MAARLMPTTVPTRRKKKIQTAVAPAAGAAAAFATDIIAGTVVAVLIPLMLYLSVVIAAIVLLAKAGAYREQEERAFGFAVALAVLSFVPTLIGNLSAFAMACAAIHLLGTMKGKFLGVKLPTA
jgi:hypothetical protein